MLGGVTLTERWIDWDDGQSSTYKDSGIPFVERARNPEKIQPHCGETLLTSHAEGDLRGGRIARLPDPPVAWQSLHRAGRIGGSRTSRPSADDLATATSAGASSHTRAPAQPS